MRNHIGIWIDHRGAKLYRFNHAGSHTLTTIESGAEDPTVSHGHVRHVPPHGVGSAVEAHAEHRRAQRLRSFYEDLARELAGAGEVVIAGPGSARDEFARVLRERGPDDCHVRAVEAMDTHLTAGQVAARFRELLEIGTSDAGG